MQPDELIRELEADVTRTEASLEKKRAALDAVRAAFGPVEITMCPPAAGKRLVRAYNKAKRTGRATVRRGRAKAAKALRTKSGRRKEVAGGSLTDRVLQVLTAFAAPMKKSAVIEQVKALPADVTAELKRLRADGRVAMVGERAGARWALPKFANVIVAEDAV